MPAVSVVHLCTAAMLLLTTECALHDYSRTLNFALQTSDHSRECRTDVMLSGCCTTRHLIVFEG